MTTREVVDRYYECVNGKDWDSWLTLFADDVSGDEQLVLQSPDRVGHHWWHFEGIDVLRGAAGAISYGYSKFLMHPKHIVVQGDEACVICQCEAANRAGTRVAYNYLPEREVVGANYFRLENGKIKYMRTIHDETAFAPFAHRNPKSPPA
jgi:hypothetical protein